MAGADGNTVPMWTLTTGTESTPPVVVDERMTPERLREVRAALAAFADAPIATLEAHPMPAAIDRSKGIHLDRTSPLASHLSQLLSQTKSTPASPLVNGGETLYRMVVPSKVASQFGSGLVRSMSSKSSAGIHSALIGPSGIAAQATFVPVAGAAGASSAATAGVAAAGAGALTVAAPLILMAVAAGVSVYADRKRQEATEKITGLLEKLHDDALNAERSSLNGCREAIDKATAVLLDHGRVGASLGLDSAVHAISTALADAELRLAKWQQGLTGLQNGRVEIATLTEAFKGIEDEGGEFRAHLQIASLAIALKKRVIALQAVEHAQADLGNEFASFTRALKRDQSRVTELETGIANVLTGLSALRLDRSHGRLNVAFRSSDVDKLLLAAHRLREIGDEVDRQDRAADIAIEIAREEDGSVVVFPAMTA